MRLGLSTANRANTQIFCMYETLSSFNFNPSSAYDRCLVLPLLPSAISPRFASAQNSFDTAKITGSLLQISIFFAHRIKSHRQRIHPLLRACQRLLLLLVVQNVQILVRGAPSCFHSMPCRSKSTANCSFFSLYRLFLFRFLPIPTQ
jgi:hypothetical protein